MNRLKRLVAMVVIGALLSLVVLMFVIVVEVTAPLPTRLARGEPVNLTVRFTEDTPLQESTVFGCFLHRPTKQFICSPQVDLDKVDRGGRIGL